MAFKFKCEGCGAIHLRARKVPLPGRKVLCEECRAKIPVGTLIPAIPDGQARALIALLAAQRHGVPLLPCQVGKCVGTTPTTVGGQLRVMRERGLCVRDDIDDRAYWPTMKGLLLAAGAGIHALQLPQIEIFDDVADMEKIVWRSGA